MSKLVYKAFSGWDFIFNIFLRIFFVYCIYFCLNHYYENPVVIIVLSLLFLFGFLLIGDDEIVVYNDKVVQKTNSIIQLFKLSKSKIILINQIKIAYPEQPIKNETSEVVVALILTLLLPKDLTNNIKTNPIYFKLKSGEVKTFNTNLSNKKIKAVVDIVNEIVNKKN